MNNSLRKVLIGSVFFALTCIAAVVGYTIAGWSLLEAIYMVVITIFGVGYGEVRPIDAPELKVFTIVVIGAGCTSAIYVVGGFVQMIAEGEFNRVLGARRMTREIEGLSNHVVICGFARGAAEAGDHIWIARYLLERIGEKYGVAVNWHCKPIQGDWNGSGMHANFSNSEQVGRSREEVARLLAGSQDLLVPIGIEPGAATEMSKSLTKLAIDLASFNNISDVDAMRDVQAARSFRDSGR